MSDGAYPEKNDGATIRHAFNWTKALNGATVTGTPSVIASGTGAPTVGSIVHTGVETTFNLSGGTYNATAPIITLTANTSAGEVLVFEVEVPIKQ